MPLPACLRAALTDKFAQFDEYQLAKYNLWKHRAKRRPRPPPRPPVSPCATWSCTAQAPLPRGGGVPCCASDMFLPPEMQRVREGRGAEQSSGAEGRAYLFLDRRPFWQRWPLGAIRVDLPRGQGRFPS